MSKLSARKTERLNKKRQVRQQHRKYIKKEKNNSPSYIGPNFPAEKIGVPAGGASWIGERIASLLRRHTEIT